MYAIKCILSPNLPIASTSLAPTNSYQSINPMVTHRFNIKIIHADICLK